MRDEAAEAPNGLAQMASMDMALQGIETKRDLYDQGRDSSEQGSEQAVDPRGPPVRVGAALPPHPERSVVDHTNQPLGGIVAKHNLGNRCAAPVVEHHLARLAGGSVDGPPPHGTRSTDAHVRSLDLI